MRHNNQVHGLDITVFRWINGWSFGWEKLFVFFSEATKRTDVRIGLVLIIVALIAAGPTTRKTALISLASIGLANTLADALKAMFKVVRPCNELLNVTLHTGYDGHLIKLGSYGTASSHSANMAALAFVMVYYFKWWGTPWVLVAVLTGLSRIYVGVHYPSQVLLGYICGLFCALLVIKTWEAFVKRRKARQELDVASA
jgi:undecaprenyl-diphosphatase